VAFGRLFRFPSEVLRSGRRSASPATNEVAPPCVASGVWRLAHAYVSAGLPGALDLAALSDEQKAIRRATHLAIRQASIEGSRLYPR